MKEFDYFGYGLKRTGLSYFRYNMESSVEAAEGRTAESAEGNKKIRNRSLLDNLIQSGILHLVLRREEYIEQYFKEIECKNNTKD